MNGKTILSNEIWGIEGLPVLHTGHFHLADTHTIYESISSDNITHHKSLQWDLYMWCGTYSAAKQLVPLIAKLALAPILDPNFRDFQWSFRLCWLRMSVINHLWWKISELWHFQTDGQNIIERKRCIFYFSMMLITRLTRWRRQKIGNLHRAAVSQSETPLHIHITQNLGKSICARPRVRTRLLYSVKLVRENFIQIMSKWIFKIKTNCKLDGRNFSHPPRLANQH